MLNPTSLFEHFIVFACLSIFCRFFYCVLVPVRLPSIPHRTPLSTTLLVPSLLLGYRSTCSLIKSGYCKPCSAPICDETFLIWTPLAKPFESVPALVNFAYRNVYGVPQERRRIGNPRQGKIEFPAKKQSG